VRTRAESVNPGDGKAVLGGETLRRSYGIVKRAHTSSRSWKTRTAAHWRSGRLVVHCHRQGSWRAARTDRGAHRCSPGEAVRNRHICPGRSGDRAGPESEGPRARQNRAPCAQPISYCSCGVSQSDSPKPNRITNPALGASTVSGSEPVAEVSVQSCKSGMDQKIAHAIIRAQMTALNSHGPSVGRKRARASSRS
jgi:hypothetical protein